MKCSFSAVFLAGWIVLYGCAPAAHAGATGRAARETAEWLLRKFGATAAGEGTEVLAHRMETLAARHGDDVFTAARKVGPRAIELTERAGANAPEALKLMVRHGDGAVWIVERPNRLALFVTYGDDAATAMMKHASLAEPLIVRFEGPAARGLSAITVRNGRRLAMLAEDGALAKSSRAGDVLELIARHGDRAMDFLWRHKAVLASSAMLASFLANPEPYLDGAQELLDHAAQAVARPATEAAREAARATNWTLLGMTALGLIAATYWVPRARRASGPQSWRPAS